MVQKTPREFDFMVCGVECCYIGPQENLGQGRRLRCLQPLPNYPEGAGKVFGSPRDPLSDRFWREPSAPADLRGLEHKGPLVVGEIHTTEFPTGVCGGHQLEDSPRRLGQFDPQLLGDFPERGLVHAITGADMPRRRGVPDSREIILPKRPLLEEQLAPLIEDQHMDRPMTQLQAVHLATRRFANDLVLFIDHIEPFLGHTHRDSDKTPGGATGDRDGIADPSVFPVTAA